MLAVELVDSLEDAQACADGALSVVAVRGGCAEHSHDRIADELLQHAAVLLDPALRARVVDLQRVADVFRVSAIRSGREADKIDEQDRNELPFLARRRLRLERRPAAVAKAGVGRILTTTAGAA